MSETKRGSVLLYTGFAIAIVGVVLSALLLCKQGFSGLCTVSMGCTIDGVDGCKELGHSMHSKVFGIVPVALLGLLYYGFVAASFFLQTRRPSLERSALILYAAVFGLMADFWFGYVNFALAIVPCMLCAATYVVTLAVLGIAIVHKKQSFPGEPAFMPLVWSAISPAVSAGILTVVVAGVLALAGYSRPGDATPEESADLLPTDRVGAVVKDFQALKEVRLDVTANRSREGSDRGYIVVQKFADFLCPHCLHASYLLQEALVRWPGRIVVVYRHFPLDATCNPALGPGSKPNKPYGDWRCNGAQASICAADYPGFASFYHGVFELQNQQSPIDLAQLERISATAKIPWPALRSCMGTESTQRKLMRDIEDARTIDIHSTPTLVVNGRLLPAGTPDRQWFLGLMDALVYEKEGQAAYDEYRTRTGATK